MTAHRKWAELTGKLADLDDEFARWRKASLAGAPLEKHHTQIRRVTFRLEALAGEVRSRLDADTRLLEHWRQLELMILDVHHIWDFFRSKLALRHVPWLREQLVVLDELAWACYRPAQARGTGPHNVDLGEVREPPLTFFETVRSPFALARGSAYAARAHGGALATEEFRNELKALPVPVILAPWHQGQHLPDALMACHEVGHQVEDDFRLTGRLEGLLDHGLDAGRVPECRHGAWRSWLGEIFADLYGVLGAGPAFAEALMDFLAAPAETILAEQPIGPPWGAYPPTWLRAQLCLAGLRAMGLGAPVNPDWLADHPSPPLADFGADASAIVQSLLDGPYPEFGGVALTQVLTFATLMHETTVDVARLLAGLGAASGNPRALMAAGALAFAQDPDGYLRGRVAARVAVRVREIQETGTRFRGGGDAAATGATLDSADREAGRAMFDRLRRRVETVDH